jgi:predicted 3-demethylubiquinone-9 3-methyltransferase (glyoxalase superfamily)
MRKSLQKITPFLWFDHEAEEAAQFYMDKNSWL